MSDAYRWYDGYDVPWYDIPQGFWDAGVRFEDARGDVEDLLRQDIQIEPRARSFGLRSTWLRDDGDFIGARTITLIEGGGVLRSALAAERWGRLQAVLTDASAQVRSVARQFRRGRCNEKTAITIIESATAALRQHVPEPTPEPTLVDSPKDTPRKPARRGGPELTHGSLQVTSAILEEINRANERDRWHVALRLLLEVAIHVVLKNRPSPCSIAMKAGELAGSFPEGLADTLYRLVGIRLDRLTDQTRGGAGRRSIPSVVAELRGQYEPALEELVFEVVRKMPCLNDTEIALHLKIRRAQVTEARRKLVGRGLIEERKRGRRIELVPIEPSLPTP